ncbi:MAG: hypothetical protein AAGA80_12690 [Cyanobacteria bacterium P01_F01_bin.143]
MKENTDPKQIMTLCLKVDEYLKTVKKSLAYDSDNSDFQDHYSFLLEETLQANWQVHCIAEKIHCEEFRHNLETQE